MHQRGQDDPAFGNQMSKMAVPTLAPGDHQGVAAGSPAYSEAASTPSSPLTWRASPTATFVEPAARALWTAPNSLQVPPQQSSMNHMHGQALAVAQQSHSSRCHHKSSLRWAMDADPAHRNSAGASEAPASCSSTTLPDPHPQQYWQQEHMHESTPTPTSEAAISASGQPPPTQLRTTQPPVQPQAQQASLDAPTFFTTQNTTLLAESPLLPAKLRRMTWRLSDFDLVTRLHAGHASNVYKAWCRLSGVVVALKVYDMRGISNMSKVQLRREVELHSSIVHQSVVALYAAFQEAHLLVLVQEWCDGGDLHTLMHSQHGRMDEMRAVQTVLQPLLSALAHLHAQGIVHRDVKPENLLLSEGGVLKLADFGLAIDVGTEPAVTRLGTLQYMAPEVLKCPLKSRPADNKHNEHLQYDSSVDAWSVGVLAYELLTGFAPFAMDNNRKTAKRIMQEQVVYPKCMSEGARSFIAAAMEKLPLDRATVMELMQHPWIITNEKHTSASNSPSPSGLTTFIPCFVTALSAYRSARAAQQIPHTPATPGLPGPPSLHGRPILSCEHGNQIAGTKTAMHRANPLFYDTAMWLDDEVS